MHAWLQRTNAAARERPRKCLLSVSIILSPAAHIYLPTINLPTNNIYLPTYGSYLPTYLLPINLPTNIYLPTDLISLPTYFLNYLPTCLSIYLPTCHIYLSFHLPTYL